MDNQEWMDAYNSYDDWKPEEGDNHGGDHQGNMGGDHQGNMGGDHQGNMGGDHQGNMGGDHQGNQNGPDGPSPAVVDAWMSGMQPDGFFDFGKAFDAAESTAKAEAQAAGEYDEATWDECADAGRDAMESARDDNKGPQEVFQAVAEAVNACGQAQQEANQD